LSSGSVSTAVGEKGETGGALLMILGFCRSDVRAAVLRAFHKHIKNATRVHLPSSQCAQIATGACLPNHLVLYLLSNIPCKRTLLLKSHSFSYDREADLDPEVNFLRK
jgi:hypothetical protein